MLPPPETGLVERREALRSDGRPRKPFVAERARLARRIRNPFSSGHADEPLAKVRHVGSRKPLAPRGAPFLLKEEMKTGLGRPRPQVKRMHCSVFAKSPLTQGCCVVESCSRLPVIASEAKQSIFPDLAARFEQQFLDMDCFVAALLAMTRLRVFQ